jgi:hypothetical protein
LVLTAAGLGLRLVRSETAADGSRSCIFAGADARSALIRLAASPGAEPELFSWLEWPDSSTSSAVLVLHGRAGAWEAIVELLWPAVDRAQATFVAECLAAAALGVPTGPLDEST